MDVQCCQFGEVPIETQSHEKASILVGQLSILWLVVNNPSRVYLRRWGNFQTSSHSIVKACPTCHVWWDINVSTVEINSCVSWWSSPCQLKGKSCFSVHIIKNNSPKVIEIKIKNNKKIYTQIVIRVQVKHSIPQANIFTLQITQFFHFVNFCLFYVGWRQIYLWGSV